MYKNRMIGLSTHNNFSLISEESLMEMHNSGIDCLELSYERDDFAKIDFEDIVKKANSFGIMIWSIHLPFHIWDIASVDDETRCNTVSYYTELITKAGKAGIPNAIIHCCREPVEDTERELRISQAIKSVCELGTVSSKYGVTLCCEDLPRSCLGNCSQELLRICGDNESVMVVFDTNHLSLESNADFIKNVNRRIKTLHISDFDFDNERHWLPGEGDIRWPELMNDLFESGYRGPVMFEVSVGAPATITRPGPISFDRFVSVARDLIDLRQPEAYGKRLENLGLWGPKES